MAGFDTNTRVPGIQYSGLNESIKLLQGAISNEQTNRNQRLQTAVGAAEKGRVLAGQEVKRDILQNTRKNNFDQLINDDVNAQTARMFTEDGKRRVLKDEKAQAQLLANQKRWEDGGYAADPAKLQLLTDNYDKVMDSGAYGQRVYDNMINAGLTVDEAEAERKTQVARWKKPEASKQVLQNQKIKADALSEQFKARNKSDLELFKERRSQGGQGQVVIGEDEKGNPIYGPGQASNKSSSSTKKKSYYGSNSYKTIKDFVGKNGPLADGEDFFNFLSQGATAQDMSTSLNRMKNTLGSDPLTAHITEADLVAAMQSNMTGDKDRGITAFDPRQTGSDKKIMDLAVKNAQARKEAGYGSSKSTGGSNHQQSSFNGIRDKKGYNNARNQSQAQYDNAMAQLLATGNGPNQRSIVEGLWEEGTGAKAPAKKKKVLETKKTPKTKKTKPLWDDKNLPKSIEADAETIEKYRNAKPLPDKDVLTKTGGKKNKDNPLGLTDADVDAINYEANRDENAPTDVYKPRPKLLEDPMGWVNSFNMSPKGEGRDTFKTSDTKSGNFKLQPNPYADKKEVLPSINSGSTSQSVTDARNNNAVLEFNRAQDARISQNSPQAKQQRAVQSVLSNNKLSFGEKMTELRNAGLSIAEAQQLLSQGRILR